MHCHTYTSDSYRFIPTHNLTLAATLTYIHSTLTVTLPFFSSLFSQRLFFVLAEISENCSEVIINDDEEEREREREKEREREREAERHRERERGNEEEGERGREREEREEGVEGEGCSIIDRIRVEVKRNGPNYLM